MPKTNEEREHMIEEGLPIVWSIFAGGSMAGGANIDQAAKRADAMVEEWKSRFGPK